ncbi:MAG: hypothetical protein LBL94_06530 [Prevotellaceae bacterium]|jgi:hypothetical protein|nr:hypothetical protein [Prevotellaceae bacterium]
METKTTHQKITCPSCGKGSLRQGGIGYVCDYFVTTEDLCKFVIYANMFGHTVTEDEAVALSQGEAIGPYELTRKDGSHFTASLQYDAATHAIAPVFDEFADYVLESVSCPCCGGEIRAGSKYYACKNSSKESPGHVFFGRIIAGVEIADSTAVALVQGTPTGYFNFTKKSGEPFTARLQLVNGEVKFDSIVCKCPACEGNVMVGVKSYYCSEFKRKPCDFHIFKEMGGREITPEIVEVLCCKRETELMEFATKNGKSVQRKIVLNDLHKAMLI